MGTMLVKNAAGGDTSIELPSAPGRALASLSRPVVLSAEDKKALDDILAKLLDTPANQAKQTEANTILNKIVDAVLGKSSTRTGNSIEAAPASVPLIAANPDRVGGSIVNDSTSVLYIKLGTGATLDSYDYVVDAKTTVPGMFEVPADWKGVVHGFWPTANGFARTCERTA